MVLRSPSHRPVHSPPAGSARHPRSKRQQRRAAAGAPGAAVSRGSAEERAAFKKEAVEAAQALVTHEQPHLAGLARDGQLLFVPRPEDYVERRTDGYREPERVFVVCVNHASPESAAAVTQVIQALRPDNVVVELCRSRAGVMYTQDASEAGGSKEAERLRASGMRRLVQEALDGSRSLPGLLLTLLSGRMQARVARQLGADIGGEMRAARLAAEAVGAQLVLGDRPIEITLERAWAALPWGRRLALLRGLLLAPLAPLPQRAGGQALLPTGDAVDSMLDRFAAAYPEAAAALLDERDLYLAWSLKRSKAVNGCRTVVGVIGAGHAAGVAYHLRTPSQLRFRDLVGPRPGKAGRRAGAPPRWASALAGNLALAAGLQAAWELLARRQ